MEGAGRERACEEVLKRIFSPSAPGVFLEERTGEEGREHLEGPRLQPEVTAPLPCMPGADAERAFQEREVLACAGVAGDRPSVSSTPVSPRVQTFLFS